MSTQEPFFPFSFAFDVSSFLLALGLELTIPPWAPFLQSHFILFSKSHGQEMSRCPVWALPHFTNAVGLTVPSRPPGSQY